MRLDHLLSRELFLLEPAARFSAPAVLGMSTGPRAGAFKVPTLLSFERPRRRIPPARASSDLENCTVGQTKLGITGLLREVDHRQDKKGIRWMPWHQESKKDVGGCDKPR